MTVTATSVRGRRWVLVQASKGVLGFAVLGLAAACSGDDDDETDVVSGPDHSGSAAGLDWWRVDFAYVSAYVLVRGREAALVDCGLGSRVDEIGAVLGAAGTGWDRVRHVLITHAHGDHYEGLIEVAARTPDAAIYAGAADTEIDTGLLGAAAAPGYRRRGGFRPADGRDSRPHPRPHRRLRYRLAGARRRRRDPQHHRRAARPDVGVHRDKGTAEESVRKLAALEPQVILFGHGPPVHRDAAAQLRRLASSQ